MRILSLASTTNFPILSSSKSLSNVVYPNLHPPPPPHPPPDIHDTTWMTPSFLTPNNASPSFNRYIYPYPSPTLPSFPSVTASTHSQSNVITMANIQPSSGSSIKQSTTHIHNTAPNTLTSPRHTPKQNKPTFDTISSYSISNTQPYIPHHRRSHNSYIQSKDTLLCQPPQTTSSSQPTMPHITPPPYQQIQDTSPPFLALEVPNTAIHTKNTIITSALQHPPGKQPPQPSPTIGNKITPPPPTSPTNTHIMAMTEIFQPDPTHITTEKIQQEADTSGILRAEFNNFPRIPNNQLNERLVSSLLEHIAKQLARDSTHIQNCREAECIRALRNAFYWHRLALWLRTYTDKSIRLSYARTEY